MCCVCVDCVCWQHKQLFSSSLICVLLRGFSDSKGTDCVSNLYKLVTIVLRDCAFLVPRLIMAHIGLATATKLLVVTLPVFTLLLPTYRYRTLLISVCYLRA